MSDPTDADPPPWQQLSNDPADYGYRAIGRGDPGIGYRSRVSAALPINPSSRKAEIARRRAAFTLIPGDATGRPLK